MTEKLFEDFPAISKSEWFEKIKEDLKGKPLKSLNWLSEEGLELFPVYRSEDLPDLDWLRGNYPGLKPWLRGASPLNSPGKPWEIRHDFKITEVNETIDLIQANQNELHGIGLEVDLAAAEDSSVTNSELKKLAKVLQAIDLKDKGIHFKVGQAAYPFFNFLAENWENATGIPLAHLKGTLDAEPFLQLPGDAASEEEVGLLLDDSASSIINLNNLGNQNFRCLKISVESHNFLGANAIQQIAIALSMAVDYLAVFTEKYGFTAIEIVRRFHFQFPIDTDFFTQVAKIRAFRMLYLRVLEQYDLDEDFASTLYIHGQGSLRNMSVLDPHVNLLRSTTELMSAVIAGCQAVSIPAYNCLTKNSDSHAARIARNTHLILRDEAFFGQVLDPAGGSYYCEYLSNQFAEQAWKQFQKIEEEGGYRKTWNSGKLPAELEIQRIKTGADLAKGKRSLLGVNKFPNLNESLPSEEELGYGNIGSYSRLAESFESLRFETKAQYEEAPMAMLWTFGDVRMRKARAAFVTNFLATGGWSSIAHPTPGDEKAGFEALRNEKAKVLVLCSSDLEYLGSETKELLVKLNQEFPELSMVIAGRPEGWESLKQAGLIRGCLYAGMDALVFFRGINKQYGNQKEVQNEA